MYCYEAVRLPTESLFMLVKNIYFMSDEKDNPVAPWLLPPDLVSTVWPKSTRVDKSYAADKLYARQATVPVMNRRNPSGPIHK